MKSVYTLTQHSALAFFLVQSYYDLLSAYSKFKHGETDGTAASASGSSGSQPFELTIAELDEMRAIAAAKPAKFMIVATRRWWNARGGLTYPDLISTLQTKGFLVLDVESMPGFEPETMLIPDDGHWSAAGHEFVAQQIEAAIANSQLLSQP